MDVIHELAGPTWSPADWTWPPNVFAGTSILLGESGAYRLVVAPPEGKTWPPDAAWNSSVEQSALAWAKTAGDDGPIPREIGVLLAEVLSANETEVEKICEDWELTRALLTLHAIADRACGGVGLDPKGLTDELEFVTRANNLLYDTGSLSRFSPSCIRVLPKMRTPQTGITLRSLSLYLAALRSEVSIEWSGQESALRSLQALNLLLFPWPFRVEDSDFRVEKGRLDNLPPDFGFFSYAPSAGFDVSLFGRTIEAAARVAPIDCVVLPEAAVSEAELQPILEELRKRQVLILLAGVRADWRNSASLYIFDTTFAKWGEPTRQYKHHRWQIDDRQIDQYHLEHQLSPAKKWWEAIDVQQRQVTFVSYNWWLTMCHLICEDLARQEPVGELIRAVGPNLVVALLQDGPQLQKRWPGKYASVLSDDPGSSVLTLTSLGMALRSRFKGGRIEYAECPVIALWSDRKHTEEIRLDRDASAVLLTVAPEEAVEYAADGRSDGGYAGLLVYKHHVQIQAVNRA
jgi:hypothetical protein